VSKDLKADVAAARKNWQTLAIMRTAWASSLKPLGACLLAVMLCAGLAQPAHAITSNTRFTSAVSVTKETAYRGVFEGGVEAHTGLFGGDNPVNRIDPSGHDDIGIGDMLAVMDIFSSFFATISPVTSSAFELSPIAFSPSITVKFSVDTHGEPSGFNASDVQSKLQTELSANVFDHPPAGHSVNINVHEDAVGPGTLGWSGSPKNTYVNRVTWDLHGIPASRDFHGLIQIDPANVDMWTSTFGKSPTSQTWVNIFAHEGIWGNAGDHWDHGWNPDGEISSGTANALSPYTVTPSNRTTMRSDFGF
jgi:hypothetical protein